VSADRTTRQAQSGHLAHYSNGSVMRAAAREAEAFGQLVETRASRRAFGFLFRLGFVQAELAGEGNRGEAVDGDGSYDDEEGRGQQLARAADAECDERGGEARGGGCRDDAPPGR
jgi:hypothetical protein